MLGSMCILIRILCGVEKEKGWYWYGYEKAEVTYFMDVEPHIMPRQRQGQEPDFPSNIPDTHPSLA
jgi:hypothetical protein